MKLIDAMEEARRAIRVEAQRENQRRYYEWNRERIIQKKREGRLKNLDGG